MEGVLCVRSSLVPLLPLCTEETHRRFMFTSWRRMIRLTTGHSYTPENDEGYKVR